MAIVATHFIITHSFGQFNNLAFHALTQREGLSELQSSYITRDSRGYIWIGGYDGLNRFDGKDVKVYYPTLSNGQTDPNISSKVFEDKSGKLWFTTYNSIHCLDPLTDGITPIELPIAAKGVIEDYYAFHFDKEENLWLVANDTLRIFNVNSCSYLSLHPLNTFVCQVIQNHNGDVTGLAVPKPHLPAGLDIFTYDINKVFHKKHSYFNYNDPIGLPSFRFMQGHSESDSVLWLPSDAGIVRIPLNRVNDFKVIGLKNNRKSSFLDVSAWHGYKFAATTHDGLCVFDSIGNLILNQPKIWVENRLVDVPNINNIFIDQEDNLWISVWGKGIYYTNLRHSKFLRPSMLTNFYSDKTQPIDGFTAGKQGQLWCLLPEKGLSVLDSNLDNVKIYNRIYPSNIKLADRVFKKIQTDLDGGLWVQVGRSLYFSEKADGVFRQTGKNLDSPAEIIHIGTDRLFLLTLTQLFEVSKKTKLVYNFSKITPLINFGRVTGIFWDNNNHLFISNGFDNLSIFKIKEQGVEHIKDINSMGTINGIAISEVYDCIWLASFKGLIKLKKDMSEQIYVKDPKMLLSRSFNAILQDASSNLWLSSNSGLFKYNPGTGEVKRYTESDGLQGQQFMLSSACKLSDGRMAFGGVNGLNIFHPDSVHDNLTPPIVHFTDWVVNDVNSISANPEYLPHQSFSYDKRTLTFHFIGIDYTAPEEVQYRYFLKGYDQNVVEAGTTSFARYAQLPAGDYTFEVWAANSDGVWTPKPKAIHFTILPPWWATWWARALGIAALLALAYSFYRFRIAQVKRQEEMRRMEAEFKQKEAEIKQQMAETETAILRLQMNPHFIFNSMNSISSYILKKDIATANDYLARFAKLMRSILNMASKPRITIADEIELLEQYMNTEAMRFEQQFNYDIHVDPAIDPEETLIPTLLLQPFIENAIWHGLSHKTSPGLVSLRFEKDGEMLLCSVQDNGIGRPTSSTQHNLEHKSQALTITARRLQLLSDETGVQSTYSIIDLKDKAGNAAGTRVEIRLPIIEY